MPTTIVRWGIIGCGGIAKKFAEAIRRVPGAELAAVGSRDPARAAAFATAHGGRQFYGSYGELAASREIDAVYVATPHPAHAENALLALRNGKAVLCEKPFTLNAGEARAVVAEARRRGLFLMEAMWTRFLPAIVALRDVLASGTIGEPRLVTAGFGFRTAHNPAGRLLNPALGGGSLLDVGVYPVSFSRMVLGAPDAVHGVAHVGDTGVDEEASILLSHPGGRRAVLNSAVRLRMPGDAWICGTEGMICVPDFWHADRFRILLPGQADRCVECPKPGNGFEHEIEEVNRCIGAGVSESAVMTHDDSVGVMETLDALRRQWGLAYPGESVGP